MKESRRQIPLIGSSKKPTYFEKYRKELQKITNQIEIQNMKSSSLIAQSKINKKSPGKSPQMKQSIIIPYIESSNSIGNYLLTPPLLELPDLEFPITSRRNTEFDSSPPTRRISGPTFTSFPSPQITSRKVSLYVNSSSDKSRDETPTNYRQSHHHKESEVHYQINSMTKECEQLRSQLERVQSQLFSKRKLIDQLKTQLKETSEIDYNKCTVIYAEKIIQIEQKHRQNKKNHEDQLNELSSEKNQIHNKNVQILLDIQSFKEEIKKNQKQYDSLETHSPSLQLEKQKKKLIEEISKLESNLQEAEKNKNSQKQLEEISMDQFNKYKELWMKRLLGQEIAQAQDHIKFSSNQYFKKEIQRKKTQLNAKKVSLMLKKKKILELYKVSDFLQKQVQNTQKQISKLKNSDRKLTISLSAFQ